MGISDAIFIYFIIIFIQGLLHKDGSINWSCPCLGGMATGPCGYEFREAFSCFHHSDADPKGSDCFETFREMQQCMLQYPAVYDDDDGGTDETQSLDELAEQAEAEAEKLVAQQSEKQEEKS